MGWNKTILLLLPSVKPWIRDVCTGEQPKLHLPVQIISFHLPFCYFWGVLCRDLGWNKTIFAPEKWILKATNSRCLCRRETWFQLGQQWWLWAGFDWSAINARSLMNWQLLLSGSCAGSRKDFGCSFAAVELTWWLLQNQISPWLWASRTGKIPVWESLPFPAPGSPWWGVWGISSWNLIEFIN